MCWTSANVVALDPQTGALHWLYTFAAEGVISAIATPTFYRNELFVAQFQRGALLLKLSPDGLNVELGWYRTGKDELNTEAIHPAMSTPVRIGDYIYGVDSYGELRCLDAGKRGSDMGIPLRCAESALEYHPFRQTSSLGG